MPFPAVMHPPRTIFQNFQANQFGMLRLKCVTAAGIARTGVPRGSSTGTFKFVLARPGPRHGQTSISIHARAVAGDQSTSLLTRIVNISSVPYTSYVPKPHTFLHDISAEMKQLWAIGILVLMSRSSVTFRIVVVIVLMLISMTALEKRLWAPQLLRVGGLCGILFLFTALGSDAAAPVLSDRVPTNILPKCILDSSPLSEPSGSFIDSISMKDFSSRSGYSYVVLWLGPFTITKRSLSLAVTLSSLTFVALQTASLSLVSTPPERMAMAVGRALKPLSFLGVPVQELVLTVLLALRFMATVFEEARNLCLGLASRGIDWSLMGWNGTLNEMLRVAAKLFSNLFSRSEAIAAAMVARGFVGPKDHVLYVDSSASEIATATATATGWKVSRILPNVVAATSMMGLALLSKQLI